jgi:hypothetical protein
VRAAPTMTMGSDAEVWVMIFLIKMASIAYKQ